MSRNDSAIYVTQDSDLVQMAVLSEDYNFDDIMSVDMSMDGEFILTQIQIKIKLLPKNNNKTSGRRLHGAVLSI